MMFGHYIFITQAIFMVDTQTYLYIYDNLLLLGVAGGLRPSGGV